MGFPSDLEIARKATAKPLTDIAAQMGIGSEFLEPYGKSLAKISLDAIDSLKSRPKAKYVVVTAITPTPLGEGKTTTTVGLGQAMKHIGKKATISLRQPSMGPTFGIKGGAAGGGYSQVIPMELLNLHLTGDFHAVTAAHNLLSAMVDNHLHQGNELDLDIDNITWRRVMDVNDRSLRNVIIGLGTKEDGVVRQTGFDITAASEVMAILALAKSKEDMRARFARIVVGYDTKGKPVTAEQLSAAGSMAVIMADAIKPNLLQTIENTPVIVHSGPFGNIAHGNSSIVGDLIGIHSGDYLITEAGFGADLGAEKFLDIKCRKSGLRPSAAVIVATVRALKYHGGADLKSLGKEDLDALGRGLVNLERHVDNVRNVYRIPCVVSINRFDADTPAEIALIREHIGKLGVDVVLATHWADGGAGAADLAKTVVRLCGQAAQPTFVYEDSTPLWDKVRAVATRVYRASDIRADAKVRASLDKLQREGWGHLPVCIAKTQMSFSTDASRRGAPEGHIVDVREVRLAAGAGFVVAICGDIMTMPGLPREPAAERIDLIQGKVVGLS